MGPFHADRLQFQLKMLSGSLKPRIEDNCTFLTYLNLSSQVLLFSNKSRDSTVQRIMLAYRELPKSCNCSLHRTALSCLPVKMKYKTSSEAQ